MSEYSSYNALRDSGYNTWAQAFEAESTRRFIKESGEVQELYKVRYDEWAPMIRFQFSRGMSRKRLTQIYGDAPVRYALDEPAIPSLRPFP